MFVSRTQGFVGLSAAIANVRIQFQIIRDCYAYVFAQELCPLMYTKPDFFSSFVRILALTKYSKLQ